MLSPIVIVKRTTLQILFCKNDKILFMTFHWRYYLIYTTLNKTMKMIQGEPSIFWGKIWDFVPKGGGGLTES